MDVPTEMQHQAMGYDRVATMFSPDGHLLQVEYAEKIVKVGSACIGFNCKDGVLIIADKRIRDKLISSESSHKIYEVDSHVIAAAAGISSDARMLIDHAQLLSQQNRVTYDSPIEPVSVIRSIADKKQLATQYGGMRPYGVIVMLGGIHKNKSYLHTTDVTGNYMAFKANAIGENDEKIKEILRQDYKEGMSINDALFFSLKIFKEILGKNFDVERFEAAYIKTAENPKIERLQGNDLKKFSK